LPRKRFSLAVEIIGEMKGGSSTARIGPLPLESNEHYSERSRVYGTRIALALYQQDGQNALDSSTEVR
jgi:hypothetical protein